MESTRGQTEVTNMRYELQSQNMVTFLALKRHEVKQKGGYELLLVRRTTERRDERCDEITATVGIERSVTLFLNCFACLTPGMSGLSWGLLWQWQWQWAGCEIHTIVEIGDE